MDGPIILARIVQYAGGATLFGTPLFLVYALPGGASAVAGRWPRRAIAMAAASVLAGAVAYLLAQTAAMAGDAAAVADPGMLLSVLTDTSLGAAVAARVAAAALALVLAAVLPPARPLWLCSAGLGAVALLSFAWTGHGAADDGALGFAHLAADLAHLLAAGVWIGALVAFALLLTTRHAPGVEPAGSLHRALAGFGGVGSAAVAVLVATGLVNGWILVGPTHVIQLFATPYGLVLLAKLVAFAGMAALAARNRFTHTPRLAAALSSVDVAGSHLAAALAALRRSVLLETGLGLIVLALVGVLGMLAPIGSA